MKAKLVTELPRGDEWVYEIKFDGVRAIAVRNHSKVQLFSRNRIDRSDRYPAIADAVSILPCTSAVLDGEIVALDSKGRSSFQLLQGAWDGEQQPPLFYYIFDILQLEGKGLCGLPLLKRKTILNSLLSQGDPIRYSGHFTGSLAKIEKQAKKLSLEGLIAKKTSSPYEIGRRSGAWVKWKTVMNQEFVIGGYTPPQGGRQYFGAIIVGYHDQGKLRFASKVGTGFNGSLLKTLYAKFQKLKIKECPFANLPENNVSRGSLTASQMKQCVWIKPQLVCEVKFQEWTSDGHLRQPVFLGIREDKKPAEVTREIPATP